MIFPSNQETFGLAPLEAAASGIPVIFKDIEVYKLLYENPYLKASTTEQFVVLIKRMMNDKDFYKEGLSISNKLVTQFDKKKIREEFISLYKSLLLN
jgi:1,2-diacylglycerol-3-alpha-glucose alpha-1,2-galactosyltransferase